MHEHVEYVVYRDGARMVYGRGSFSLERSAAAAVLRTLRWMRVAGPRNHTVLMAITEVVNGHEVLNPKAMYSLYTNGRIDRVSDDNRITTIDPPYGPDCLPFTDLGGAR